MSRCCKVPVGLELGCRECTPGSHSAGSGAALDPSAPSHLGSAASVSSFLPFQGFWSFSISFSVFLSLALLLQVLFWEVCIPVSPFQSWYVKLGNGRCDSWAHISFFLSSSNVSISFFLAPSLRLSHLISTHFQSFQKTFAVFFIFLFHDILKIINLIRRWELFG